MFPIPDVAHLAVPWNSNMVDPKRKDSYRPDGSLKGPGWLGPFKNPKGQTMTEYSLSSEDLVDPKTGKELDFPSLVPGLTPQEIQEILLGKVSQSTFGKALDHARSRQEKNLPLFATEDDYNTFLANKPQP
jgi:hypothetical protein